MKTFALTILLATLTGGIASAAGFGYSNCANNNSKACRDARAAFAEHHNGQYPERWYNQWYQGQPGRWSQNSNNWSWEGARGDQYRNGRNGWQWSGAGHRHGHDRD